MTVRGLIEFSRSQNLRQDIVGQFEADQLNLRIESRNSHNGVSLRTWPRQTTIGGKPGFHSEHMPLYLLTLFAKNERANLSMAERNELAQLVRKLIDVSRQRK